MQPDLVRQLWSISLGLYYCTSSYTTQMSQDERQTEVFEISFQN